jgi:hypothetical protein
MATANGKTRINAYITIQTRSEAVEALKRGETLSDFIDEAMRVLVERRKVSPGTSTPGDRLPPGRRPKP